MAPPDPSDTEIASTESLVELFQGSLYGEEDDAWIHAAAETAHIVPSALVFPWNVQWRLWLLKRARDDASSTLVLQQILAGLQADLVFVKDDSPFNSVETNEQDDDDLLFLATVNTSRDWKKDRLISAWTNHQRYFVLEGLQRQIFKSQLSLADQGLVRAIVQGIDRLTGSQRACPEWLGGKGKDPHRSLVTPAIICKSYFEKTRRKAATKRSLATTTTRIVDKTACYNKQFHEWIYSQLPNDATLTSLVDRLGQQGSRGELALRLCSAVSEEQLHVLTRSLLSRQVDDTCQSLTTRRGKALLEAFSNSNGKGNSATGSVHSSVLFAWSDYSGVASINEVIERYLQGPALPDVKALAQWLWQGADLAFNKSSDKEKSDTGTLGAILAAVKRFADWLPLPTLLQSYRWFLHRALSLESTETSSHIMAQSKALMELLNTWIGDKKVEWLPILWTQVFCETKDILLCLYHSVSCLASDFISAGASLNAPRILTACTVLLTSLEAFVGDTSCRTGILEAAPSLAGIVAVFSRLQVPGSSTMPQAVRDALQGIIHRFQKLGDSTAFDALPRQDFLHSLIHFADTSLFASAPNWCLQAVTTSAECWNDNSDLGDSWLRVMLARSGASLLGNSILQCLHDNMVQQCWLDSTNPPKSLVELLLETSTNEETRAAAESLLRMTPAAHLFTGCIKALHALLKRALEAFDGPSVPCIVSGVALRLDALSLLDSMHAENYSIQRNRCLSTVRAYLLDKVRRHAPLEEWVLSLKSAVTNELTKHRSSSGVALEWWKEACLDMLEDHVLQPLQPPVPMESIDASMENVPLLNSRKRAASALEAQDAQDVARLSATMSLDASSNASKRSKAARQRLQQVLLQRASVTSKPVSNTAQDDDNDDFGGLQDEAADSPHSTDDSDDYDEDDDRILLLDL